jgi:RHS repeat-associated protein
VADQPANNETILKDVGGKLIVEEQLPDGTTKSTRVSAAEALKYVDRMVAAYGADNVPVGSLQPGQGGVADRTLTRAELISRISYLAEKLLAENHGDSAATIAALRASVTSPKTIQAIAADPASSRETLLAIWPDLDRILAWTPTPGPGGEIGGTGVDAEAKATSLAEAGGGTGEGTGPLPEPTPPPLVEAITGGQASQGTGDAKAPPGGNTGPTDAVRVGDPVLPFSGQLLIEAVDLEVDGIGLDVRITRTYMHATGYDGPLGPHWDHSYNLWLLERLEQVAGGQWEFAVYRSTGRLSAERFVADDTFDDMVDPAGVADLTLSARSGTHDRLEKVAGRYRLLTPDGLRIDYGDNLRAERLVDRNGNEIRLTWGGNPLVLERLVDTCGRTYRFAHDADGHLTGVYEDALGRETRYAYDTSGRLERVLRRTVEDGPLELVQAFRYRGEDAPRGLEANIVAIIDANRREVLQIDYGEEPGLLSYNRVTEQRDGGITRYVYAFISEPDPDVPDEATAAGVLRVEMTTPDGALHVLDYNSLGRLATHSLEAVDVGRLVHRWRYNADGNLVVERRPDGSATEYVYGRDLYVAAGGDPDTAPRAERIRFGELRRVIEHRRAGVAGPPQRITEYDYGLPGLVKERRGPYYADALGNQVGTGPPFAVRVVHDAVGNPTRVVHPDCNRPDGTTQTGLELGLERDSLGRLKRKSIELEDGSAITTTYEFPSGAEPPSPYPKREVADADGLALERLFAYDAAGRIVRAETPSGLVESYTRDLAGRLLKVEERGPDVAPAIVTTDWAPHDIPLRTTRRRSAADGTDEPNAALVETFQFDAEGDVRASTVRSADGSIERRVEIERGPDRRVRRILQDGVAVEKHHDSRGLVMRIEVRAPGIAPLVTTFSYDAAGRMRTGTAASGETETMIYDGFGRIAERRLANGSVARFKWDAADHLLEHQVEGAHPDVTGAVVLHRERYGYDAAGRLSWEEIAVFDPAQPATPPAWSRREYFYDRADRIVEIRGPGPGRQRLTYDGLGRVVRAEDDAGTTAESHYHDAARRVDQELTAAGTGPGGPLSMTFTSTVEMDARGQVTATVDGLGNRVVSELDSAGNVVATVDSAGIRHEKRYAPDGVVDEVRLAAGTASPLVWRNHYDAQRRLAAVDGPRGRVVDIGRDGAGRVASLRVAAGGATTYHYDDSARLTETREPSGIVVKLDYGPGGRVRRRRVDVSGRVSPTARDTLAASSIRYEYDGLGQLVLADDGTTPVARRYDSRGLLVRERTGTRDVRWSYDLGGAALGFQFSDGTQLAFERATDGRLRRVLDATPATPEEIAQLWPLGAGMVRDVEWRQTVRRLERRDPAGRLLGIDALRLADGSRPVRLLQLADERSFPAVRQTTTATTDELRVYDVDDLARIVGQTFGSALSTAATDALAQALDVAQAPAAAQADVDAAIAQARAALPSPVSDDDTLHLDPDGARTTRAVHVGGAAATTTTYTPTTKGFPVAQGATRTDDADGLPRTLGSRTFTYDDRSRLASTKSGGGSATTIERDALGRVHRIAGPGGDVELVHDGMGLVEAHRSTGETIRLIRPPGSRMVLEVQAGTERFHPFADPDGTTIALIDSTAAVAAFSGYDAFGRRRGASGSWPPLAEAFHGMPPLVADLFLSGSRTYDADVGAFLEHDQALHVDGPNLHLFAHGNPTAFTDPLGLMAQPGAATGRGAPDGAWYGHGSHRPDTWYLRALSAMAGALWSVWGMITEPVKQVYDLLGGLVGFVGDLFGIYHYEHRYASGIGQLAEEGKGTLDIFAAMGKGVVETPKRVWDDMERGDYASFGADALNLYMLGRSALGVSRAVGGFAFNRSVAALGETGPRGAAIRARIRTMQIKWETWANRKYLGPAAGRPVVYSPLRRNIGMFDHTAPNQPISVYESAFTPSLKQMFIGPSKAGGLVGATSRFARFRWGLDNFLRGNMVSRTLIHEHWHAAQFALDPGLYTQSLAIPEQINPFEWTQPPGGLPGPGLGGAYNQEMIVPYGPLAQGILYGEPLTLSLSSAWGSDDEARQ